jgi:hypothetical protein
VLAAIAPGAVFINAPLDDSNFDVIGVQETVAAVRKLFGRWLLAEYPDAKHEFPLAVRERAYGFLERELKR